MYRESTGAIVRSDIVGPSIRELTVGQLMTATQYRFTVQASNELGTSDHSPRSDGGSFSGEPFEPVNVVATGGLRSATIRWEPPPPRADETPGDNGSAITGYEVEVFPSCSQCTGLTTSSAVTTIDGLEPATEYSVSVRSVNENGSSNPSLAAHATTDAEPPSAPTLDGTHGDEKVTLTWSAPSELRGSHITGFRVQTSPDCPTCSGLDVTNPLATSTQVTGLQNKIKYRFDLFATSDAGDGDNASIELIPHRYTYVALGDSYSSGQGARQENPEGNHYDPAEPGCYRSDKAYGHLFANDPANGDMDLLFLACAGAVTERTPEYQPNAPDVVNDQVDSLPEHADLVTISVGGDDVGFGPVLIHCSLPPLTRRVRTTTGPGPTTRL